MGSTDYTNIQAAWSGLITDDFWIGLVTIGNGCPIWMDWACPGDMDYPVFPEDLPAGIAYSNSTSNDVGYLPHGFGPAIQCTTMMLLKAVMCDIGKRLKYS